MSHHDEAAPGATDGADRASSDLDEVRRDRRRLLALFALLLVLTAGGLRLGAEMGRDSSNDPWSFEAETWQQPYVRWDAEWYLSIARDGYFLDEDLPSSAAFFPGYPVGTRWLGEVLGDDVTAGLLLAAGSGLAALLAIHGWARAVGRPDLSLRAATIVALTPFSMYLYGPLYADSLLLASTVAAFWALERDRAAPMVVAGTVAAASRVIGAVVPVLLAVRLVERRRRGAAGSLHPALPVLCYSLVAVHLWHLWSRFGDPLAFRTAAGAHGWNEGISLDSITKLTFWDVLSGALPSDPAYQAGQVLSLGVVLVVVALLPRTARVLSPAYALAAAALIGIPLLSNDDFLGFGRYALAAFPVSVALADLLRERPALVGRLVAVSGGLLAGFTVLLGMDYLIA